ncbi:MAG: type III-B CRISPR module RAMP protein Cmr6 [Nitrospirae bacterium]|nr:MAG: type III-B CRISPR module RAMP protein Cmr6 [Nitrospirota bacterium]
MRHAMIVLKEQRKQQGQHPGLLLQRYLCEPVTGQNGNPQERRAVLQAAINAAKNEHVLGLYRTAFERWKASCSPDSVSDTLVTQGRLIVGLGSENVLETGIRLHHTYGTPIIPGSALKGLASHYCDQMWGQRHIEVPEEENRLFRRGECYHNFLFGTTDDGGAITFHDAWIVPESLKDGGLCLDVMTPHHPNFQRGPESPKFKPPTDFDSPTPVPFLSVSGSFHLVVSWNGPEHAQSPRWTTLALTLLKQALADWGVGGKTSSGYGRLIDPTKKQTGVQQKQSKSIELPKAGETVQAVLLEKRTKKGGWRAKHETSGLIGPIQNSHDVPPDKRPGDTLILLVASANEREMAFRYPTATDEHRAQQFKGKTKGAAESQSKR